MPLKSLIALLVLSLSGLSAQSQTPTADQLNAIRNLPQDQQNAILQSLGKGDGTGRKTDPSLSTPDTIRQTGEDDENLKRLRRDETRDGHQLRRSDEDPELKAEDSILIDLAPFERARNQAQSQNGQSGSASMPSTSGQNGAGGTVGGAGNPNSSGIPRDQGFVDSYGRNPPDNKRKSDDEKARLEEIRKRILRGNPYRLNRFGVLEIPGLPSIPLAGLTASEATNRLMADPDLREFAVKLTLLRLQQSGEEALKPFGYDLFEGVPSTFAPVSDIQVPIDYLVGPGDTLEIQLYGNEPAAYSLTVGRDGRINFPKLGPVMVSGMTFAQARETIDQRVGQQLIGSRVSVTMGDLRSIRVFVLGEAQKPGSYTVSGLSTMTNALFVSGGVKKIGSLRKIELKRNGRLVTVLDLYDLLLHGDTSGDRQLMPGDVIFIPPIGSVVSVDGAVRRPAIYELKNETAVAQVIDLAGGLLPESDQTLVQMERILPSRLHEMRSLNLMTSQGRSYEIANGDKFRIPAIRPTLENSVVLSGFVFRPGSFEYRAGLRLSDIIPSFDELRPNADRRYIMIRREVPPEEKVAVVSADLEQALRQRGSANDPELRPRDQVFVFDLSAGREKILAPILRDLELQAGPNQPAQTVTVNGKVKAPGEYPWESTMRVSDLIRAGGSLEDAAYGGEAELTRYQVTGDGGRESYLIPVNLAAIRQGDVSADVPLRPYDILVIKPTPQWDVPGSITLTGEVRFPGKYPIHRGERLKSILQRAGGFTDLAFPEGAVLIREELKEREQDQIEILTNRMQSDLAALSLESIAGSVATSNANASNSAAASIAVGQQLLAQLRDTQPVGRLVINVDRVVQARANVSDDVALRDGDKLLVPRKPEEITIVGEVQSPTSHVFQASLSRDDYIAKSGGATQKADRKRIYVVRANGDVVTGQRGGWFRRTQRVEIRPGDTIVVPLDTERVRSLPLWQAVTTIIYNLAVALLAVRSV